MHAGALDRIISIKAQVTAIDVNTGQKKLTFSEVATRRANVRALNSREELREEQDVKVGVEKYIFTIRYYTGLTTKHLITYDSRDFDITGLAEIGRKRWWRIQAENRI